MALTATAQSALQLVPSWDETIVPTLRKRLENESRALAKRISAASIASIQDNSPEFSLSSHSDNHYHREDAPSTSSFSPRPSGIPRPSLQSSRPSISDNRPTTPTATTTKTGSPFKRSRTLSQPKLMEHNTSNPSRPDARAPSPNTPRPTDVKRTRIPVPRTRTPSASGHPQAQGMARSESHNRGHSSSQHNLLPPDDPSLGSAAQQNPRRRGPSVGGGGGGSSSSTRAPRPSIDSEERPFEHWYRGEVSRNGGVGELRVGRRMEMLEIANYGHSPGRPADHWRNGGVGVRRRRRAGSTDVHRRGSFYMEADGEHARVLDEAPPTDVEDGMDFESDFERRSTESVTRVHSRPASSLASHQYPGLGVADSRTNASRAGGVGGGAPRSRSVSRSAQPSRIPTPSQSRQVSDPPRTPTPPLPVAVEPESPKTAPHKHRRVNGAPPSPPQVPTAVAPQTPKKRAKSPAAAIAQSPSTKKSRSRAPPVSQPRPNRDNSQRRSIGEYPVPADEDMLADAIPTWTQPVSPGGNWDDVVVPVVARKKGMDEFYTSVDGRQQKRPRSRIPEPAPGTFGYDYTKYRQQLEDGTIPMADIDVDYKAEVSPPAMESQTSGGDKQTEEAEEDTEEDHVRTRVQPSPAPFSRYQTSVEHEEHEGRSRFSAGLTTADIRPLAVSGQVRTVSGGEDQLEAGCCKCVIM